MHSRCHSRTDRPVQSHPPRPALRARLSLTVNAVVFLVSLVSLSLLSDGRLGFSHPIPPTSPPLTPPLITTPADARALGLESLHLAVQKDGGVPLPQNLGDFVSDRTAAIQLGKALFWEMQVGSDGVQACGSCHSQAGADSVRKKNQLNPALLRVKNTPQGDIIGYYNSAQDPDTFFEVDGPNHTLSSHDFPFIRTPNSLIQLPNKTVDPDVAAGNKNDIVGSQGVFYTYYYNVIPGQPYDRGTPLPDAVFNVKGINTRRVEQRNTPQNFNAVLNFTNFWDGRANNHFNGVTPFGQQDATAFIFVCNNGKLTTVTMDLENASLASQAVGPPVSFFEMSYGNGVDDFRTFPEIGRKLLDQDLVPLARQLVDPTDSVLGKFSGYPRRGLCGVNYKSMIQKAFLPKYWSSAKQIAIGPSIMLPMPSNHGAIMMGPVKILSPKQAEAFPPDQIFTQMEANFSMFFGISIMLYESTLLMDQTPFDHWMETGRFSNKFGPRELAGLNLFAGKGLCINCHEGPELSSASVRTVRNNANSPIDIMQLPSGQFAPYDEGFFNTAVVPTTDDIARGGADPFGRPLSFARQYAFELFGIMEIPFPLPPLPPTLDNGQPLPPLDQLFARIAIDGAFKTASPRGTELTGPYFHNGGVATLRQAVDAYDHAQNFPVFNSHDVDVNIQNLGLTEQEKINLTAFLVSLTDPRVRIQAAPFDHPQIYIPNGHPGNEDFVLVDYDHQAKDSLLMTPAVGAAGDPDHPLGTFLGLDPQDTNPTGNPDAFTTSRGGKLWMPAPGVLANDASILGKPLQAVLYHAASHGTVELNKDGSFIYCPAPGFTGKDSFAYVAVTGTFDSNPTVVTLTVRR